MAPATRRSTSSGVSKPPSRKSKSRDDSFHGSGVGLATSVLRTDADAALQSQPDSTASFSFAAPSLPPATTNGFHDVMQPLSAMAERVGREVEDYAEQIDRWRVKLLKAGGDDSKKYKATVALMDQLEGISKGRLANCKARHSHKRGRTEGLPTVDGASALRDAQIEVDTWRLFRIMLDFEFRDPAFDRELHLQHYFETKGNINAYTAGSDVWERFMMEHDTAREQAAVLRWLEQTARASGHSSEEILDRLETKCGSGTGSYDRHWLYTREKLKSEKRNQVGDEKHQDSFRAGDSNGKFVVSQLDPDAPTRQMRVLEPRDAQQDKAVWEACFQMLRSGIPWAEFTEWLDERGENWRGASLGIAGGEQAARVNVEGPDYGTFWRRLCYAVARRKDTPAHEKAVYGLLAGDLPTSREECASWDDYVYVHLNALLLGHFQRWLEDAFPDKVAHIDDHQFPRPSTIEAIGGGNISAQIVGWLRQNDATRMQALEPEKQVQGALISRQFVPFAATAGAADTDNPYIRQLEKSETIPLSDAQADPSCRSVIENETTLRLLVHFSMILEELRPEEEHAGQALILDRVVISYLDFLRRAGKFETLPTYAAFMKPQLADKTLGMMLADVADYEEQRTLINLMNKSGMNAVDALAEQVSFALNAADVGYQSDRQIDQFEMLEPTEDIAWPGVRVSATHIPEALTVEEEKVVRAAEWYARVDGHLYQNLELLTQIYRCFLVHGHWNAAVAITERVPYRTLVDIKTPAYYGRCIDFMEDDPPVPDPVAQDIKRTTRASSRQPSAKPNGSDTWGGESRGDPVKVKQFHRLFKRQGRTYYELMQLTEALRALSEWRVVEDNAQQEVHLGARPRNQARTEFKQAFDKVCAACEPMLHDFLTHPRTSLEDNDLSLIRTVYLPSIIIAYNSALHFAGTFHSREHFLKSLELATIIARDDNQELRESFIRVERMSELTRCLSLTSRQLLRRNEEKQDQPKNRDSLSKKRSWDGRTLEVWDIGRKS